MIKPAILLMSFGTPAKASQLPNYYRRIQHGRYPHQRVIRRIAKYYQLTGGIEYFAEINYQQGAAVAAMLSEAGIHCPIALGFLHVTPSIEAKVRELVEAGVTDIYGLPLMPYYSNYQSEAYHRAVVNELRKFSGITYHRVNGLWNQPALLTYWQDQLIAAKRRHPWQAEKTQFLFIADALPRRVGGADPYRHSVELNARRISHMLGLTGEQYAIGWVHSPRIFQPDRSKVKPIEKQIKHLVGKRHASTIVVVPIGFLTDSLLLDYDVCIKLRQFVMDLGASMIQLPVPNASPELIKAITDKLILSLDQAALTAVHKEQDERPKNFLA